MTYTIDCIGTNRGWRYRVALWQGRAVLYYCEREYKRHQDAVRAAKATGATPKPERKA